MGLYRDCLLPWAIDRALDRAECRELRQRATRGLHGTVLEVGFGSGLNLPHYPGEVRRIFAVDPATFGRRLAARRLAACSKPVEFIGLDGNSIALASDTVQCALSTWTLCTIPGLVGALREIMRVLQPGGSFHFLEHGLSPDDGVARWQRRLDPLQKRLVGGCRLTVPIDDRLAEAGFAVERLETFYMKGPRINSYIYLGVARKAGLI